METKINYQKELEKIIKLLDRPAKVFLHSCCAPCSSYCMEYLRQYFDVTVFYYNPNITDTEEYAKRVVEQERLIEAYNTIEGMRKISFVKGAYEPDKYLETVRGFEMCKEGGSRCGRCFELRLHETARLAKEYGMDYFTTTLTISPLKNAQRINEIGNLIAEEQKIPFLPSDFKKNNGYLRSIELSKEYGLYRQDYCGCEFSKR